MNAASSSYAGKPPSCEGEAPAPLSSAATPPTDVFVRKRARYEDTPPADRYCNPVFEEDALDEPAIETEQFPIDAPLYQFQIGKQCYKRLAIPGYPELVLGYEVLDAWKSDIPGDLSKFKLFKMSQGCLAPLDFDDVWLEHVGPAKNNFLGPRITDVASQAYLTKKGETYHEFTITCETGAKFLFDVYGPFWDPENLIAHPKLLGLAKAGLMLPTLALFASALMGSPFQIATQFDGTYKIMPRAKKGKHDNTTTLADSEGHFYAQSLWDHQKLVATLFHENMGHNTQCDEIYPLLVLAAIIDEYEPHDAVDGDHKYAQTNIREFWAVAHEDYTQNPALFHKTWPNVGRLLQSVYTKDGSRFRQMIGSYEQLGFRIRMVS